MTTVGRVAFRKFHSHKKLKVIKIKTSKIFEKRNKRPMGLDARLENLLSHLPNFHIYSLSNPGVEIELIFTLGAAVSEIQANFQNGHIWA